MPPFQLSQRAASVQRRIALGMSLDQPPQLHQRAARLIERAHEEIDKAMSDVRLLLQRNRRDSLSLSKQIGRAPIIALLPSVQLGGANSYVGALRSLSNQRLE